WRGRGKRPAAEDHTQATCSRPQQGTEQNGLI
ncbi:T0046045 isoform 1, partial [Pan troglodytes]